MKRARGRQAASALIVCAATAVGCQPKNEYAPPPPPAVEVAQPVERPVIDYLEFTGTTRAVETVDLRARVNGYLEQVHFEDGARVEKGQLLFTLEQAPFRTMVDKAEAELKKAKASLQLAESELARQRTLVRRDAATIQELDVKQAERAGAAASVDAAEAALQDARLQLGYTEIHAPIRGRIGRNLVDEGNLVQAEQTLLATIQSDDPIYVDFTLSEGELLDLSNEEEFDAPDPLHGGEQVLEMGLSGQEGYPYEGRLDYTDIGVDSNTGTLQLRGIFPNSDRRLLPGLFTRVRTAVGSARPRLLVPERAIGVDQQGDYVLVVDEKDTVEYRSVTLGQEVEGMRVVSKGLEGNEWIVVNGIQRARPGSPVDPERPEGSAEAAEESVAGAVGAAAEKSAAEVDDATTAGEAPAATAAAESTRPR